MNAAFCSIICASIMSFGHAYADSMDDDFTAECLSSVKTFSQEYALETGKQEPFKGRKHEFGRRTVTPGNSTSSDVVRLGIVAASVKFRETYNVGTGGGCVSMEMVPDEKFSGFSRSVKFAMDARSNGIGTRGKVGCLLSFKYCVLEIN